MGTNAYGVLIIMFGLTLDCVGVGATEGVCAVVVDLELPISS